MKAALPPPPLLACLRLSARAPSWQHTSGPLTAQLRYSRSSSSESFWNSGSLMAAFAAVISSSSKLPLRAAKARSSQSGSKASPSDFFLCWHTLFLSLRLNHRHWSAVDVHHFALCLLLHALLLTWKLHGGLGDRH